MKQKSLTLLIAISICFLGQAQSVEKVKGNRNVTIQQTPVNSFKTVIVDEGFEIDLVYSKEPYVEIETDENLHEFFLRSRGKMPRLIYVNYKYTTSR